MIIRKDILILGKGPTQGLGGHSLTAEKMYSMNYTATGRRFCLSLDYNGANSYLFVNGVEIIEFKAKVSEVIPNVLCLWNASKDFSASNMRKAGLYGTVYDFSADYGDISIDDLLSIPKYLIKKHNIVWNVWICEASIYFSNDVFSSNLPSVNSLSATPLSTTHL